MTTIQNLPQAPDEFEALKQKAPATYRAIVSVVEVGERAAEALALAATMTVRVRDRSAEAPWGVGPTSPIVRRVTISAACRVCGGKRGTPSNLNQCDDGVYYSVDVWTNACGHVDSYAAVVKEAKEFAGAGEVR